jgi:N-acetylneuraminate synthase|tara:strand:+ start:423 stop:1253 length:831 start_codon:yes stop_codon:yes gene_type:complete
MVFITAEIGINHNGDINIAKKLIDIAKNANCDAVKFQKRTVEKVYSKQVLDSPRESPWGTTTREQKLGLEFNEKEYDIIDAYCKEKEIEWFASSWDIDSQLFLRNYHLKHNKIASAMLTNTELLNLVAEEKKHTFISTGMSTIDQIEQAVKVFKNNNCPFELMHSNSSYPMKPDEANLQCIKTLKEKFNCNVGYSGHESSGYNISLAAAVLGATSIERHITMARAMYGSDQAASLEPLGLVRLVRDIRMLDLIMGDGVKKVYPSEIPVMKKLREQN